METKTIARIGAVAFVSVVVTATALQMRDTPPPPTEIITLDEEGVDPLAAELRRCQLLGAAGANDKMCLRAWAENRSRFFISSVQDDPQLVGGAEVVPLGNDSDVIAGNAGATASPVAPPQDGER
jgi:conjugative transfer region protein TrbK